MVKKTFIMNQSKLLAGDLLYSPNKKETALLVRETKNYWYYIIKDHNARVHKQHLWKLIDENRLAISCNFSKRKRKVQPKWRTLDLHNTKHHCIEEKVKKFLNWAELPVRIVTGNSIKMKTLVIAIVKEYSWHHREELGNTGCLIIEEKEQFNSKKRRKHE
mgnify:CR=1 FL=1